MWAYTRNEMNWLEEKPNQFPVYPKTDGRTSLTDEEIRAAVERGHVLRAEYTQKAVASGYKIVADIPEKIGNWLRNGETAVHSVR